MALTYKWTQGNTHTQLQINLIDANNNPISLVGVLTTDITLKKRLVLGNQKTQYTNLAGSVVAITDAVNGIFTYQFAPSDVATPGKYLIGISVNFGTNDNLVPFPITFEISDA